MLMTRTEWTRLHTDFKTIMSDGTHCRVMLNPKTGGTELVPVEIVDDSPLTNGGHSKYGIANND